MALLGGSNGIDKAIPHMGAIRYYSHTDADALKQAISQLRKSLRPLHPERRKKARKNGQKPVRQVWFATAGISC